MAKEYKILMFISNEIKAYKDEMPFSPVKVANILKDNKYRFDKGLGNWHFHTYIADGNIKWYSLSRLT